MASGHRQDGLTAPEDWRLRRPAIAAGAVRQASALGGWGAEQQPRPAKEIARPGANWLRGPFPKAGREFRPPGEAEPGVCGGAGCGRGLGPHAPKAFSSFFSEADPFKGFRGHEEKFYKNVRKEADFES